MPKVSFCHTCGQHFDYVPQSCPLCKNKYSIRRIQHDVLGESIQVKFDPLVSYEGERRADELER